MSGSFTVNITHLTAAESVISADGFKSAAGPEIEKAVVLLASTFRAQVREAAPLGRGRLSQWQRRTHKGHGSFRKSISLSSKRAGFDTVSRVRAGPIGNILRSGAKPHDIKPLHGLYLFVGGHLVYGAIHHPGFAANDFWARATASLEGQIEHIAGRIPFATADVIAARIASGR